MPGRLQLAYALAMSLACLLVAGATARLALTLIRIRRLGWPCCVCAAAVCLLYNMQVFGSWQYGGVVYGYTRSNIQLSLCSVTGTSAQVRAPCMRPLLCTPAVWMLRRMLSLNVLSSHT